METTEQGVTITTLNNRALDQSLIQTAGRMIERGRNTVTHTFRNIRMRGVLLASCAFLLVACSVGVGETNAQETKTVMSTGIQSNCYSEIVDPNTGICFSKPDSNVRIDAGTEGTIVEDSYLGEVECMYTFVEWKIKKPDGSIETRRCWMEVGSFIRVKK